MINVESQPNEQRVIQIRSLLRQAFHEVSPPESEEDWELPGKLARVMERLEREELQDGYFSPLG